MRIGYVSLGGLTTDPDGSVAYDFDGHIHASGGLDIDAADADTITADHMIRFLRASDGDVVSELYSADIPLTGTGDRRQTRFVTLAEDEAQSDIGIASGGGLVGISAVTGPTGNYLLAVNDPDATERVLLTDGGASDYAQLVGGPFRLAIAGYYQVSSGLLNPGDTSEVDLFHNLHQDPVFPLAARQSNGAFGAEIGWSYTIRDSNTVGILFEQLGPTGLAHLELNVFLLIVA